MGKKNRNKTSSKNKNVSILTCCQLKRIPFIHNLANMINNQVGCKINEWVIVNGCNNDDDHDKFNDEIKNVKCNIPIVLAADKNLEYKNVGAFRNLGNRSVSGEYIVCMDDDDFYFKDYVNSCVTVLKKYKNFDLVGCSGMLMYDYGFDTIFKLRPFGPNHTVNCCMAYRKSYADKHFYDETRKTGEEKSYLNDYKSSMYQLPYQSAIIHMSYSDNTFNGKRINMLGNMTSNIHHPDKVPRLYNETNFKLKDLINNDTIYNNYQENFKKINNMKETDIVFYYGNIENEWDPTSNSLHVKNRKSIDLGKEFLKKGYSVSVYAKFTFDEIFIEHEGIYFYNLMYFNVRNPMKYLIIMDYSGFVPICQYEQIFKNIVAEKIIVDVHSFIFPLYKYINELVSDKVIFTLKNPLHIQLVPESEKSKLKYPINITNVPNGVDLDFFNSNDDIVREPKRFCYTSSYNNGIYEILKYSWPEIIKVHPDAELHIYYGFKNCQEHLVNNIKPLLTQDGVYEHGRVSHQEIAIEFKKSSYLFYYNKSNLDLDCISVMEASASGCIPIIWNKNVYAYFRGIVVNEPPNNENSFKKLSFHLNKLLNEENDNRDLIKKSNSIFPIFRTAEIFIDLFNDKVKINKFVPKIKETNDLPTKIDLNNYVDSDSDSDSETNYESDSEDENKIEKNHNDENNYLNVDENQQVDKNLQVDKELENKYEILKKLLSINHPLVKSPKELFEEKQKNNVLIFSSGKVQVHEDKNIDNFLIFYYRDIAKKLNYEKISDIDLHNLVQNLVQNNLPKEEKNVGNIDLSKYVDSDSDDSDNEDSDNEDSDNKKLDINVSENI